MATEQQSNLSLHELLGSTLTSIIDAQKKSLEVTKNFIEEFGFGSDKEGDDWGELKTVTFQYSNDKGKKEVSVPLLSLFPIPMLKIKDAEIDFDLKISSTKRERFKKEDNNILTDENSKMVIRGAIAPSSRLSQQNLSSGTAQISVKVNLVEEDLTPGLTNFYNLMAGAVTTENIPNNDTKNIDNSIGGNSSIPSDMEDTGDNTEDNPEAASTTEDNPEAANTTEYNPEAESQ